MIALIITIILLLILAGITIKVLTQRNMLEKTTQATNKYKEEVAKEEVKIAWSTITTETYNYTSSHAVWRSNYSNGTGSRFTGYRGTSKVNDVTAPYAYGFRVCLYLK